MAGVKLNSAIECRRARLNLWCSVVCEWKRMIPAYVLQHLSGNTDSAAWDRKYNQCSWSQASIYLKLIILQVGSWYPSAMCHPFYIHAAHIKTKSCYCRSWNILQNTDCKCLKNTLTLLYVQLAIKLH